MIYQANDKYSGVLTSGYTVGQSTLYVSAVPDNVPTIVVAGKGTDNETVFEVTDKTANSLTGVSRLKGANVDLDAQTPLTCLNNQEFMNQYVPLFNLLSTGWQDPEETWEYSSWDDTNGVSTAVITVPSDARTKYQPGMRVKFDQPTDGTKYGIITKVAETALTVFLNTDYDFDNETITNPYYSPVKAPLGFPLDPTKWSIKVTDNTNDISEGIAASTWTNVGSHSIDIPIGCWRVSYAVSPDALSTGSESIISVITTLSTANNTESDPELSAQSLQAAQTAYTGLRGSGFHYREKVLTLAAKDTYYLNVLSNRAADLWLFNRDVIMVIKAVCAYL